MECLKLEVKRRRLEQQRTIGDLFIDGHLFCQTLEDVVRPAGEKVPGQTAIPAGRYEIRLTYSQRFKQVMPQLMLVPNFEGIRIHSGNTEADTSGCLLVGKESSDRLVNSRDTYNDLMDVFERCKTPIYITISNS
jgi:hypothetical protein